MGYSQKRVGKRGTRWTAVYFDIRGERFSAGTFSKKTDADRAWQDAEAKVREGRAGDPRRGRQLFKAYVEEVWLPHHVMEASTREGYTYQIGKHIMPWFGGMKLIETLRPMSESGSLT